MLQAFADWFVFSLLGLDAASRLGSSVNFFVYDTVKIYLLTFTVLTAVGFLRTFLSPATIRRALSRQRFGAGNVLASGVGAVTPFCSCSSIPLFIGFLEAGIPLGIAFSFIITSPLVNEVVFVLMGGLFGWRIAFLYSLSGIALGTIAGVVIGKMGLEKEIILNGGMSGEALDLPYLPKSFEGKMQHALREGIAMFRKLWWVIAIGVALGAAIHGYVPQEFFEKYLGTGSFLAVPVAVLIGIPIYAGCSSLVPVIFAFVLKGIPLGTALAFLMAVSGLSLPEGIMLRRVMTTKLLAIFFGIVGVGIVIIGYLFNALQ
ncbi:MAG: permease [Candidatus Peribacteraceae bacterium]|nr:permease [Candidatus Peribacteraceae bacterium]